MTSPSSPPFDGADFNASAYQWPAPTLTSEAVAKAASELASRRLNARQAAVLPADCRPHNLTDAWAVQQQVAGLLGPVIGWKCGSPSVDASGQLKIVAAPLYQDELQQGERCALWPDMQQLARVEPEYAYPLLQDLPAGTEHSDAALLAAFGQPRLALELIQSRYTTDSGATYLDQLADGLFNQGLWLGPTSSEAGLRHTTQPQFLLQCRQAGVAQLLQAVHPDLNPQQPLLPLIRLLHSRGIGLSQGQYLITGSFAGVLTFPLQQPLTLTFAGEAALNLQFIGR